jgi:hypothetical protein
VQNDQVDRGRDFTAAKDEITSKIQDEKASATRVMHDVGDQVTAKASEYASEVKEAVLKQADGTQRDISSNLAAFGGALRAASEHLANADQKTASKFVLDAAGGLESLSGSLKNKPFEEVLGDLRSFGNNNAGALIAGSVLAGLALGRFLKSSGPGSTQNAGAASSQNGDWGSSQNSGSGSSAYKADRDASNDAAGEPSGSDYRGSDDDTSPVFSEPTNDWPTAEPAR